MPLAESGPTPDQWSVHPGNPGERAYPDAKIRAGTETSLGEDIFPADCPCILGRILGDRTP